MEKQVCYHMTIKYSYMMVVINNRKLKICVDLRIEAGGIFSFQKK